MVIIFPKIKMKQFFFNQHKYVIICVCNHTKIAMYDDDVFFKLLNPLKKLSIYEYNMYLCLCM